VGSVQTASHDGYATFSGRLIGPLVLTLDYSSLVPAGQKVTSLTLGLGTDDFQSPAFGQPFIATNNGQAASFLSDKLSFLDDTGPAEHFFTIGISPSRLLSTNVLTVSIDEGGDGFAMDFATVGVITAISAVPEPSALAFACLSVVAVIGGRWRKGAAEWFGETT
jgi:hypothetical protein